MPRMGYSVLADSALATARTDTRRQATHILQRTTAQSSRHEPRPRPSCPTLYGRVTIGLMQRATLRRTGRQPTAGATARATQLCDHWSACLAGILPWLCAQPWRYAPRASQNKRAKQNRLCAVGLLTRLCGVQRVQVDLLKSQLERDALGKGGTPRHPIPSHSGSVARWCALFRWAHAVGWLVVLFCAQARRSRTSKRSTLRAGAARWRAGYPWGYAIGSDTI
jgi:hypothetical protein